MKNKLAAIFIVALLAASACGAAETAKPRVQLYDVVVIGAGGAGLNAAVTAADKGAKVAVLEKMPVVGANTILMGGFYNSADPERQEKQGIKDSAELHAKQTLAAGDNRGNPDLVRVMCENALDGIKWYESLGVKFADEVFQGYGALYPRSHPTVPNEQGKPYIRALNNAAKSRNVSVLLNTRTVQPVTRRDSNGRQRAGAYPDHLLQGAAPAPLLSPARNLRSPVASYYMTEYSWSVVRAHLVAGVSGRNACVDGVVVWDARRAREAQTRIQRGEPHVLRRVR